eukprot:GHVU01194251.1.p1 GENE.GHVU01194251.1~~GHVU01194251.1.p1  ORF type:complete len:103 (+),score=3.70 GHVU01194251.1:956-1264(+)
MHARGGPDSSRPSIAAVGTALGTTVADMVSGATTPLLSPRMARAEAALGSPQDSRLLVTLAGSIHETWNRCCQTAYNAQARTHMIPNCLLHPPAAAGSRAVV